MRWMQVVQVVVGFSICLGGSLGLAEEIPFRYRDGLIWLEVRVPSESASMSFLLDTGAQASVLNATAAQRLGAEPGRPAQILGVRACATGFWTQLKGVYAGQVRMPERYLVMNLQELGQACTNGPVDGIIGADFFRNRIVEIDYRNEVVRVLPQAHVAPGVESLPLKHRRCGMLVAVEVNGSKPQWVRLDTGCASALQWVSAQVRPRACTSRVAVALRPFSISVTKTSLRLGRFRFEAVPADLHEEEIFPGEKGLLGNGVLSRFQTVTIDSKRHRLLLTRPAEQGSE